MDVNPHSAYHAAGIKLLPGGVGVNDVACSGGIGADGRPLLAWCQRFSGCTPRAVIRECNYFTS